MASIDWEGNRARLMFRDEAGKQCCLRLGRCTKREVARALEGFEHVLTADRLGSTMNPDGVRWLEGLSDVIYKRVVRLGLAEPRAAAVTVTMNDLLTRFDDASIVKASTRAAYKQASDSLRDHFKESKPINSITQADADDWRKMLAESKLAPATVAKRVHIAKAIFRKAVKWKMLESSPFGDLRAGSQCNPERSFYVPVEAVRSIMEACPDDHWRAIIGLSRFAGLRCPSEVTLLRWGDVNWEHNRLTVRSPKTEAHDGHAARVVPIAPELRPILLALFDRAEPGAEAVVPRLRDPKMNLRTTFRKIIERVGLTAWPRLFHNMRASCATDWVERFPNHVVAGWLGHSPLIAAQHYLQTRDAHFDLATGKGQPATNPATQARRSDPKAEQAKSKTPENPADLVGVGAGCDPVETKGMGAGGFEPPKA